MAPVESPQRAETIPNAWVTKSGSTSSRSLDLPAILVLSGLCLLAVLCRTQALERVSFWFDEACSWKISQMPLPQMLDAISRDAHPPLYYFLMKFWTGIFGPGVIASRSLSVLAGMGSVLAACWFVKTAMNDPQRSGTGAGSLSGEALAAVVLAGLLIAINPLQVEMGQEARPYTLGVMLALLSGTFALRIIQNPGVIGNWVGFVLTATAVSLLHYYGLFTLLALFLFLLMETVITFWDEGWNSQCKRMCLGIAVSAWCVQLIWSPWISVFMYQRQRTDHQLWMKPLAWERIASTCWKVVAGGKSSAVWPEWTWLAVVIWLGLAIWLLVWGRAAERLAGLGMLVPWLGIVAYGLSVRSVLGVHYLIFAEAFLLMGCALLVARGRLRATRWGIVALVLAWNGFWLIDYLERRKAYAEVPGTQGAIAYLNEHRQSQEPVIIGSPLVHTIALQYVNDPARVLTVFHGDHRNNILSGPPLRDEDYAGMSSVIESRPNVIWTIRVNKLFKHDWKVPLPDAYRLVSAERFPERFGYKMELVVCQYELKDPGSAQTGIASRIE